MSKLKILVSLINKENDFQVEQAASVETAAISLNASVQIIYADNDAVLQTQQILGCNGERVNIDAVGPEQPRAVQRQITATRCNRKR